MRKNLRILVVVLASASTGARAQEIENGFYAIVESGGMIVKGHDGKDIHLGERLPDKIEKATVRSWSNDNNQFALELQKSSPFSRDGLIALWLGGPCLRFSGQGTGPGVFRIGVFDAPRSTAKLSRDSSGSH